MVDKSSVIDGGMARGLDTLDVAGLNAALAITPDPSTPSDHTEDEDIEEIKGGEEYQSIEEPENT